MLIDYLQIHTLSIVFVGDFNPKIIQPFWLVDKKLIRELEGTEAKIDIIHSELVKFSLGWVDFEVTKERFELRTSEKPYFEAIRDLAMSIFSILKETPIRMLGINHLMHYTLNNDEQYYKFGDKLVPLNNWNDILNNPKILQIEILEEERKDKQSGNYRIRIQPSDLLKAPNSVSININDHFDLKASEKGRKLEMLNLLKENWNNSFQNAELITEKIWDKINS